AEKEYNDDEKIIQIGDHHMESNSSFIIKNDNYALTASKYNGRQTLWEKNVKNNENMEIRFDLSISAGYAKIVFIDGENNITILAECTQDGSTNESGSETVSLTSGRNRIRIVAYDCQDLNLKFDF
ncbi:MAG: hypothetical protein K2J93_00130, partial [Anaeroplasmataceae bacterium]|nr:hypothetical protein [Anaeroplasmataceae bacterium]